MAPLPKTLAERFWPKVDVRGPDECWPWMAAKINGYGKIRLGGRGSKHKGAHVVAYELTYGPIPEGLQGNHRECDNRGCCNPRHVYAGTPQQNMEDKVRRGRHNCPSGEDHAQAKLDDFKVLAIREDDRTQGVIASDYGVTRSLVGMIQRHERWSHVATK